MRFCDDDRCGKPLDDAARSDSAYCSNACRQRAYRRRKRLLAPYDGDPDQALRALLAISANFRGVTDTAVTREP